MSDQTERKISRREFVKGTAGLTVGSAIATLAQVNPALAGDETPVAKPEPSKTPTPPQDSLDVEIEGARKELQQIQKSRPKRETLQSLRDQIKAELNPQKQLPVSDPRDARIADLQKQLDDFKKTLYSDPKVKVFTDEQLKKYIDSGVEIRLGAKEAEAAPHKAAEATKRAEDLQEIIVNKTEAQRIKDAATAQAKNELDQARVQAAALKGKIELPLVGETDARLALAGSAVAGGLLGRWIVRPLQWGQGVVGLVKKIRGRGAAPAGGATPTPPTPPHAP